jgi:hypothetical protein
MELVAAMSNHEQPFDRRPNARPRQSCERAPSAFDEKAYG